MRWGRARNSRQEASPSQRVLRGARHPLWSRCEGDATQEELGTYLSRAIDSLPSFPPASKSSYPGVPPKTLCGREGTRALPTTPINGVMDRAPALPCIIEGLAEMAVGCTTADMNCAFSSAEALLSHASVVAMKRGSRWRPHRSCSRTGRATVSIVMMSELGVGGRAKSLVKLQQSK